MYDKNSILLWPGYRQAITGTRIVIPKVRLFPFGNGSPGNLQGGNRISQTNSQFPKAGTACTGFGKGTQRSKDLWRR